MKKQAELYIIQQAEKIGITQIYSSGRFIKGMKTEWDTQGISLCPSWLGLFESLSYGKGNLTDLKEYKQILLKDGLDV